MATPAKNDTPKTEVTKDAPPAPPVQAGPPAPPEAPQAMQGRKETPAEKKAREAAEAEERLISEKEAELYALRRQAKLKSLDEEINRLKYGGKGPAQVRIQQAAEALREATFKETDREGKVTCYYRIPEQSFKKGALQKPGFIMDLPYERLPGPTWEAVRKVAAGPANEFAAI